MSLSSEGYFPRRDWLASMPGSKTQHEDVIASDADAHDNDLVAYDFTGSTEAAYAEALDQAYAESHQAGAQRSELTMPVSEAHRRIAEEHPAALGAPAVSEAVEFPDQQAA